MSNSLEEIRASRKRLWAEFGNREFSAKEQIEARLYKGQRGIYRDKVNTATSDFPEGITKSVLHLGDRYEDDLMNDGILYHYPESEKPGYDKADIQSTKNAKLARLPVFVLVGGSDGRRIYIGRVDDWDDSNKLFLIRFVDSISEVSDVEDKFNEKTPFQLTESRGVRTSKTKARSAKFEFDVKTRYGGKCAVCDVSVPQMLEAAHIRSVSAMGSDDPRNGLVLCRNHHAAFDAFLFTICAETFEIVSKKKIRETLKLSKSSIEAPYPHPRALKWHNEKFAKK